MKYMKQFCIILAVSFAGEGLRALIPLPIPANIYGIVLMLLLLCLKVIRLEQVKDTALYLVEIMPLMFVPTAAGLLGVWDVLEPRLVQFLAIAVVPTVIVMGASGHVTQWVIRHSGKEEKQA